MKRWMLMAGPAVAVVSLCVWAAPAATAARQRNRPTPTPTPTASAVDRPVFDRSDAPRAAPPHRSRLSPFRPADGRDASPPRAARAPSPRPCGAEELIGTVEVVGRPGSTVNGTNLFGGVKCGTRGGGAGAPEKVYEFEAKIPATYEIAVQGQGFAPVVQVRRGDCQGAYVACALDTLTSLARLSVDMGENERIAIIVDGNGLDSAGVGRQGPFTLSIKPRLPDLVVQSVTVPPLGNGGGEVVVAAEVRNIGNGDAGPFTVEIGYARDAEQTLPVGDTAVTCNFDRLAAGETIPCKPARPLPVPLVAAGQYVIGAVADPDRMLVESNDDNNRFSSPAAVRALGVELIQQLFRASDGASYQVLYARPTLGGSSEERYRILTISGSSSGLGGCSATGNLSGSSVAAIAGPLPPGQSLHSYGSITRTAILEPNDLKVGFDPAGGGRLTLGDGSTAQRICHRPADCGGPSQVLMPLDTADARIPAACIAVGLVAGSTCDGFNERTAIAFGLPDQGFSPECANPASVTIQSSVCAPEPADGFRLDPGQVVVFVHNSDLVNSGYSVGVSGMAIDGDGINAPECPSGTVLTGFVQQIGFPAAAPPTQTPTNTPTQVPLA